MLTLFGHIARRSLAIAVLICYAYQLRYFIASHWKSRKVRDAGPLRDYAVLIAARNESAVIAALIKSVKNQSYPASHLDVIVVADNCLTEDIQLTAECIVRGEKIGYAERAVFYDEQPTRFMDSVHQRMRWIKGYFQVFKIYGEPLIGRLGKPGGFAAFDMLMSYLPAFFMMLAAMAMGVGMMVLNIAAAGNIMDALISIGLFAFKSTIVIFALGVYTMISEHRQIYIPIRKKIWCCLTFSIFMFTYAPIAIAAMFKQVNWTPVPHRVDTSVNAIKRQQNVKA